MTTVCQVSKLFEIKARAAACGVHNLQLLQKPSDVTLLEPYVHAVAGLLSPSTGIVDSHAYGRRVCETCHQHTPAAG